MGSTRTIFAFNGDADGLCALQQLALAEGIDETALLVSGPKRRTALLKSIEAGSGALLTVLDVSFHTNRAEVERLMASGVRIRYFDHHFAGDLPQHPLLDLHVDCSPDTCTSLIVDRYLNGSQRAWAIVGAFGDNMEDAATRLAASAGSSGPQLQLLRRLGMALNYNSYADSEADMFVGPLELFRRVSSYADPLSFIRDDSLYVELWNGYERDMRQAEELQALAATQQAALFLLPDADWARRVIGNFANHLARNAPHRAHAVLLPNGHGGMAVSVRSPLVRPVGAAALCLAFPTGGGRDAAAGINHLPLEEVPVFTRRFVDYFRA